MQKPKVLFVVLITLICIVPLSYALSSVRSTRQVKDQPTAISHALQVVSMKRVEDRVKVVLKNVSNKSITAYQISVNGGRVQYEFLDADDPSLQELTPGSVYEDWFPLSSAATDVEVTVLAVVFTNGKSEGDERFIKEIKDVRLGQRMQFARILPLIRKVEGAQDLDTAAALTELEAQIRALPEIKDATLSGNVGLGLHNGKEFILNRIKALKHTNQTRGLPDRAVAIGRIKERTEKKLAALAEP